MNLHRYRPKSSDVRAVQVWPDESLLDVIIWCNAKPTQHKNYLLEVETVLGIDFAGQGDWILQDSDRGFMVVEDFIFQHNFVQMCECVSQSRKLSCDLKREHSGLHKHVFSNGNDLRWSLRSE